MVYKLRELPYSIFHALTHLQEPQLHHYDDMSWNFWRALFILLLTHVYDAGPGRGRACSLAVSMVALTRHGTSCRELCPTRLDSRTPFLSYRHDAYPFSEGSRRVMRKRVLQPHSSYLPCRILQPRWQRLDSLISKQDWWRRADVSCCWMSLNVEAVPQVSLSSTSSYSDCSRATFIRRSKATDWDLSISGELTDHPPTLVLILPYQKPEAPRAPTSHLPPTHVGRGYNFLLMWLHQSWRMSPACDTDGLILGPSPR